MEKMNTSEGERESQRDLDFLDDEGIEDVERPRERERRTSALEEERPHKNMVEGMDGRSGPSGVQVTIRADGERAVNSDGHVRRVAGRLFVELRCPHCPNQKSITFKVAHFLNISLALVHDHIIVLYFYIFLRRKSSELKIYVL